MFTDNSAFIDNKLNILTNTIENINKGVDMLTDIEHQNRTINIILEESRTLKEKVSILEHLIEKLEHKVKEKEYKDFISKK